MKKSQILATLALAFALGVAVIPTASTYAKITDDKSVTDDQKKDVYNQIKGLLDEVADLEHYNDYAALYNAFEGKSTGPSNGLIEKVDGWQKGWLLEEFNSAFTNKNNVNANITAFNSILKNRATAIKAAEKDSVKDQAHDNFREIPLFTNATNVSSAYTTVENMIKLVDTNLDIMNNNYQYIENTPATTPATGNVIFDINNELAAIKSYLTGSNAWTKKVDASAKNIFVSEDGNTTYVSLAALANNIKAIDFNAYNKMTQRDDWTSTSKADMTGMEMLDDLDLIISTAKGLPKYNYVNAVATAVAGVTLVQESNPADVSYANAVKNVAALREAIAAYKSGKAPVTPTDPDTKPGDGDKDPTAPDTGIVADAEGNASTTVAMVAGVATALTAAGAGVVAYRNARRSTRK